MESSDLPASPLLELLLPVHPVWRAGSARLYRIPQEPSAPGCWAVLHAHGTWLYRLHPASNAAPREVWQVHVGDALCTLCRPRMVGVLTAGDERRLAWKARHLLGTPDAAARPRIYWRTFLDFRSGGGLCGDGLVALGQARVNGDMVTVVAGDGPQGVEERALPPAWVLLQRLGMWWLGETPQDPAGVLQSSR